jgi:hypothetical protein
MAEKNKPTFFPHVGTVNDEESLLRIPKSLFYEAAQAFIDKLVVNLHSFNQIHSKLDMLVTSYNWLNSTLNDCAIFLPCAISPSAILTRSTINIFASPWQYHKSNSDFMSHLISFLNTNSDNNGSLFCRDLALSVFHWENIRPYFVKCIDFKCSHVGLGVDSIMFSLLKHKRPGDTMGNYFYLSQTPHDIIVGYSKFQLTKLYDAINDLPLKTIMEYPTLPAFYCLLIRCALVLCHNNPTHSSDLLDNLEKAHYPELSPGAKAVLIDLYSDPPKAGKVLNVFAIIPIIIPQVICCQIKFKRNYDSANPIELELTDLLNDKPISIENVSANTEINDKLLKVDLPEIERGQWRFTERSFLFMKIFVINKRFADAMGFDKNILYEPEENKNGVVYIMDNKKLFNSPGIGWFDPIASKYKRAAVVCDKAIKDSLSYKKSKTIFNFSKYINLLAKYMRNEPDEED